MNSVEKTTTLKCIFASGALTCPYFNYLKTLFGSLMIQDSENQPITSPKYTVMMPS